MLLWIHLKDGRSLSGLYEGKMLWSRVYDAMMRPEVTNWGLGQEPNGK